MASSPTPAAARLLSALREVLAQVADPLHLLQTILQQAVNETGADRGVFVEVREQGDLEYSVLHRFKRSDLGGEAGQFSRSVFGRVLDNGEGVLIEDALNDPRLVRVDSVQAMRLVSILCMPILVDRRIAALVHLENGTPGHFQPEHKELLGSLLEVAGPALEALRVGGAVIRQRDELLIAERRLKDEAVASRDLLAKEWSFGRFVGRAPAVRSLEASVRKAAATEFPLLVLGETGTGKSILARVLHHAGPRSREAFVTVFCPSLGQGMVEAELFGHRKGAFTGALADRVGKVQASEGGTLFLDEIGDLPIEIQPKLLRLLQERTFERVGDHVERRANVRVIAATNRDLDGEVQAGRFRRDLYERLNFIPIRVPPLRERKEDIPELLQRFLAHQDAGRWIEVKPDALDYLVNLDFTWPGNVRHVEQLAARLCMEGKRTAITREDIQGLLGASGTEGRGRGAGSPEPVDLDVGLPALLAQSEKAWLEEALRRFPGLTRAQMAQKLRISEAALYKKLRFYNLGG